MPSRPSCRRCSRRRCHRRRPRRSRPRVRRRSRCRWWPPTPGRWCRRACRTERRTGRASWMDPLLGTSGGTRCGFTVGGRLVNVGSKTLLRAEHVVPRSRKAIGLALAGLAFVIWALWLRPEPLGGRAAYMIVSGRSMLPELHGGDLVAVRRRASYAPRGVVASRIPPREFRGPRILHPLLRGRAPHRFALPGGQPHPV